MKVRLRAARIHPRALQQRRVARGGFCVDTRFLFVGRKVAIGEVFEQRTAQAAGRALLARAVEGNVEADSLLEEQMQRGVEVLRVAQVRDHFAAVDVGFEKTQLHAIEGRQHGQRTVVHHFRGFSAQNAIAVVFAVLQVRDHEMRHVLGGRGHRTGGRRADYFKDVRLFRSQFVALGHQRHEVGRQRLTEARVLHVERPEYMLVQIIIERFAGHPLHDVARQRRAVIGVGGGRPGSEHALGYPLLEQRFV